jgi:hypothetical protein
MNNFIFSHHEIRIQHVKNKTKAIETTTNSTIYINKPYFYGTTFLFLELRLGH